MNKINIRRTTKSNIITLTALVIAFIIAQGMISTGNISNLLSGLLVPICMYIILAVSLNLTVGILGELSLGHAGFMCAGAFASSVFSILTKESIPSAFIRFPLALLIGGLVAALFGIIIGIPVLRLRGDYLAIVTLAFGEIVKTLVNNIYLASDKNGLHLNLTSLSTMDLDTQTTTRIINGPMGIQGTPNNSNFVNAFILLMITLIVIMNLIDSRTGRAIKSIRDNRIAAESVGINITKYKLIAFVTSAFFAGIAGVIYSHNFSTLTATTKNFGYNMSILILVFVVLGGLGNIRGSIISAAVLYTIPEILRSTPLLPKSISALITDNRMLIYAIVLISIMLFRSSPNIIKLREMIREKISFLKSKNSAKKEVE